MVDTSFVLGAAEGIVTAKNPGILAKHGGHLKITKSWAKFLFHRMGFVKRKGSNAGKVTVAHLGEMKEVFLADISAEVLMNGINPEMVFNWDQTAIHYVSTGQWTMHQSGEKIVAIAHSEDKRQITAVLSVTMMGKYFLLQLIYQGKKNRCHPVMTFLQEWDTCHSESHWSTEESMKWYWFDCFRGQTTPDILAMFSKNNIRNRGTIVIITMVRNSSHVSQSTGCFYCFLLG